MCHDAGAGGSSWTIQWQWTAVHSRPSDQMGAPTCIVHFCQACTGDMQCTSRILSLSLALIFSRASIDRMDGPLDAMRDGDWWWWPWSLHVGRAREGLWTDTDRRMNIIICKWICMRRRSRCPASDLMRNVLSMSSPTVCLSPHVCQSSAGLAAAHWPGPRSIPQVLNLSYGTCTCGRPGKGMQTNV